MRVHYLFFFFFVLLLLKKKKVVLFFFNTDQLKMKKHRRQCHILDEIPKQDIGGKYETEVKSKVQLIIIY